MNGILCQFQDVDAISVGVEPGAVHEEDDVVGEVEDRCDEGETGEEEDEGPCCFTFR